MIGERREHFGEGSYLEKIKRSIMITSKKTKRSEFCQQKNLAVVSFVYIVLSAGLFSSIQLKVSFPLQKENKNKI